METTNIEVKRSSLDEIDAPEVLYKYRYWANYHKRFLINKEVYMASPDQFDDKLDCKIPIRYDLLTEKEALKVFENHEEPSLSQMEKAEKFCQFSKGIKNKKCVEKVNEEFFKQLSKKYGILSLTAEKDLDDMWINYANKHTGFCIGYNSRVLFKFFGSGSPVIYYDELPIIKPEPIMSVCEIIHKEFYSKKKKWSFEKEYRAVKSWKNITPTTENRQIKIKNEAFHSIILGKKMSKENKKEIISRSLFTV